MAAAQHQPEGTRSQAQPSLSVHMSSSDHADRQLLQLEEPRDRWWRTVAPHDAELEDGLLVPVGVVGRVGDRSSSTAPPCDLMETQPRRQRAWPEALVRTANPRIVCPTASVATFALAMSWAAVTLARRRRGSCAACRVLPAAARRTCGCRAGPRRSNRPARPRRVRRRGRARGTARLPRRFTAVGASGTAALTPSRLPSGGASFTCPAAAVPSHSNQRCRPRPTAPRAPARSRPPRQPRGAGRLAGRCPSGGRPGPRTRAPLRVGCAARRSAR